MGYDEEYCFGCVMLLLRNLLYAFPSPLPIVKKYTMPKVFFGGFLAIQSSIFPAIFLNKRPYYAQILNENVLID